MSLWIAALHSLVARHDSLRIVCGPADAGPELRALPMLADLPFDFVDLSGLPQYGRLDIARDRASECVWTPFDLNAGVMWRTQLVKIGDADYVASMVVHHLVSDAVSIMILRHDLLLSYQQLMAGVIRTARRTTMGFIDYLVCMNAWLAGSAGQMTKDYWVSWAARCPRPNYAKSYVSAAVTSQTVLKIPTATVCHVLRRSRSLGTTPAYFLLAAQALTLHRRFGDTRIVIANVHARREFLALAHTSGYLADRSYVMIDIGINPTMSSLVERLTEDVARSYNFRFCPYEVIRQSATAISTRICAPVFNYLSGASAGVTTPTGLDLRSFDLWSPGVTSAPAPDMPYCMTISNSDDYVRLEFISCYEELQGFAQEFLATVALDARGATFCDRTNLDVRAGDGPDFTHRARS